MFTFILRAPPWRIQDPTPCLSTPQRISKIYDGWEPYFHRMDQLVRTRGIMVERELLVIPSICLAVCVLALVFSICVC